MPSSRELDHEGQIPSGNFCLWVILWSERDVHIRPLHSSSWLDLLGQVDLSLELLPMSLGVNQKTTPEDRVDFIEFLIVVGIGLTMITPRMA
jgi:hypothetical protein